MTGSAIADSLRVRFPARLTQDDAVRVLAQWRAEVSAASSASVEVDASALQRFDSSAIAVLLELRRHLLLEGRGMELTAASQRLSELVSIYGVAEFLET
jgi:phospholipid transport system transporter-binding protein